MQAGIINPFHFFYHQGNWHVINVEAMTAGIIEENAVPVLKKAAFEPKSIFTAQEQELLNKMDLLSENGMQTRKEKNQKNAPIVSMALFITQSCNLRCIYCYGNGGEYGTRGNMEEKTAYQAVDWLAEKSGKAAKINITFFGGEPFLNFTLMAKVVKYAQKIAREKHKEVVFDVTTNATLLDDEKISFIKEHGINVMVSIDGPKEIQDVQRPYANGEGSYDSIVPGIKKLLAVSPETPSHAVIVGDTDPHPVRKSLQELGFKSTSIMPFSKPLLESDHENLDRNFLGIWAKLDQEAEMWIKNVKNRDSGSLRRLMSNSQLYSGLLCLMHKRKRHYPCGAGTKVVGVSCQGDVYLCHRFVGMEEYKLGSIFNKHLDMGDYAKSPIEYVEQCRNCFARYYCSGGCKYDNASSCGSAFSPSPKMCKLRCRELELAAYISCILDEKDCSFLIEQKIIPRKPCPLDFG